MSEHKHTKGPWRVVKCQRGILGKPDSMIPFLTISTDQSGNGPEATICEVSGADGFKFDTGEIKVNDEANARLIAAAPELLEALVEFPDEYDYPNSEEYRGACCKWWEVYARPAIARAAGTGKEAGL